MYESFWQLQQKPFENTADRRFYFPGESHQAALLKLRYAIENRRGAGLLAGASGSGKTLVAEMLREALDEQYSPFVHLVFPQMSTAEFMSYLADELDSASRTSPGTNVAQSVRRIGHFLAENTRQGRHAVVAVDEAHLLEDPRTFEALRLLLNFEQGGRPGLTLLLIGQPAILPVLERMPQLEERIGVKCLTRPLTEKETAEYVAHRLQVAGGVREIFDPEALATLHTLTHGIPRQINRLCDLALLIGFAEERSEITAENLHAVSQELVAVVPE